MKSPSNKLLIEALRAQIKVIAFDANLFDLGIIKDNPYQESCSKKRRELNAEIIRLGGVGKPLPFEKKFIQNAPDPICKQIDMFVGES